MIPEAEAALIQHERWATSVEARLARDSHPWHTAAAASTGMDVKVLAFGRHPSEFTTALLDSNLGRGLAMRGVDIQPGWANGAKILMAGPTPTDLLAAGFDPANLRVWTVVALKEDEPQILAALGNLQNRSRPRVRQLASQSIVLRRVGLAAFLSENDTQRDDQGEPDGDEDEAPLDDAVSAVELNIRHTFVHFADTASTSARTVATQ